MVHPEPIGARVVLLTGTVRFQAIFARLRALSCSLASFSLAASIFCWFCDSSKAVRTALFGCTRRGTVVSSSREDVSELDAA